MTNGSRAGGTINPRTSTAAAPAIDDVRWRPAERVELKYCVPASIAASVLEVARLFLHPETGLKLEQSQPVTSLYLDTPDLQFMRRHIDDAPDRFKLRIRAYSAPPWPTVFAEIKHKRNGRSRKRRAEIPFAHLSDTAERGDLSFAGRWVHERASNLDEFVWRRLTSAAAPKVLVRSKRESLRGVLGDQTAVTVDRGVVCQPMNRPCLDGLPGSWRAIPLPDDSPSSVLVELKHGERLPAWMRPLISSLAGWQVSFSKYVAAMRLLAWEARG